MANYHISSILNQCFFIQWTQLLSQDCLLSYLLSLPRHPPYTNWTHCLLATEYPHLWNPALHGPVSCWKRQEIFFSSSLSLPPEPCSILNIYSKTWIVTPSNDLSYDFNKLNYKFTRFDSVSKSKSSSKVSLSSWTVEDSSWSNTASLTVTKIHWEQQNNHNTQHFSHQIFQKCF